jgi:hypothetical protein
MVVGSEPHFRVDGVELQPGVRRAVGEQFIDSEEMSFSLGLPPLQCGGSSRHKSCHDVAERPRV